MIASTALLESLLLRMEGMAVVVTEVDYSTTEEQTGTRLMFTKDFPHCVNLQHRIGNISFVTSGICAYLLWQRAEGLI